MKKTGLIAVATASIFALSCQAWADGPLAQGNADHGKELYEGTCIACHGEDGKGAVPGTPDFTSKKGPLTKKDDVLLHEVENGIERPGAALAMPAMGGNPDLSEQDVKDIIAYIRKTFRKD